MPSVKVGILVSSISRRAGGLFWSVRSLSHHLLGSCGDVSVFSTSDEFSGEDIAEWGQLDVTVRPRVGPQALGYARGLVSAIDAAELDVVHTHGLWMFPSVAALRWSWRRSAPIVISPRGMLDLWALQNSAWKKRLAGALYENAHLQRAACLHALCESEYQAIRSYGLRNPVAILPNGVDLPDGGAGRSPRLSDDERLTDQRRLLFLGRLHPKKGVPELLKGWARARGGIEGRQAGRWRLIVAGWDEGGHEGELRRLAAVLGVENSVQFVGPLFGEEKEKELVDSDAFVLPSHSEGLPMAVLEAWAAGLPVLMTRACNLPEGFDARAALAMAPEAESIANALIALFSMSPADRRSMGARGRQLVEQRFAWPKIAEQMCETYQWVLGRVPKPDHVVVD